MFQNH